MALMNFTSNTASGFLQADYNELKSALIDATADINSATVNGTALVVTGTSTLADAQVSGTAYADALVQNGTFTTSGTIDWTAGHYQSVTLGSAPVTLAFTDFAGPSTGILEIQQDGTGSRTITWPASVKWPGGTAPTLSTTASSIDVVSLAYNGSVYYASSLLDMQ